MGRERVAVDEHAPGPEPFDGAGPHVEVDDPAEQRGVGGDDVGLRPGDPQAAGAQAYGGVELRARGQRRGDLAREFAVPGAVDEVVRALALVEGASERGGGRGGE